MPLEVAQCISDKINEETQTQVHQHHVRSFNAKFPEQIYYFLTTKSCYNTHIGRRISLFYKQTKLRRVYKHYLWDIIEMLYCLNCIKCKVNIFMKITTRFLFSITKIINFYDFCIYFKSINRMYQNESINLVTKRRNKIV